MSEGVVHCARLPAPFAVVGVRTRDGHLTGIDYLPHGTAPLPPRDAFAAEVCHQIACYVADARFRFDLPLEFAGTPFRQRVWREIAAIPGGSTVTYGELAARLGTAARAVGAACGDNPIPLVIPCHRVLAAGGLGGFMHASDGFPLAVKRWLLAHEGV